MGSKRRRLALSCVDCRRRKVKCDRSFPACLRCQRGGHADTCSYVSYDDKTKLALPTPTEDTSQTRREESEESDVSWGEEADHWQSHASNVGSAQVTQQQNKPTSSKRPQAGRTLQTLENRVLELESSVRSVGNRTVISEKPVYVGLTTDLAITCQKNYIQEDERSVLRGSSFKTKYLGPSHPSSLLLQFPELADFVKEILRSIPALRAVKESMKKIRKDATEFPKAGEPPSRDFLITLIPNRERADRLVEGYLRSFETTYRILHVPTFLHRYELFWSSPEEVSDAFLVQLILVAAIMNIPLADDPPVFVSRSSLGRVIATKWIEVSEAWLGVQSSKHVTLEYFQLHVLLTIAKRMNLIKVKREWTVSGTLLRIAMASGLHREPTLLNDKISVFDQEMRRRLWYTIIELEAQSSCNLGMPAAMSGVEYDVLAPLNINDEDFCETTKSMPASKPLSEYTRTAFLCAAQRHLPLRLEMLSKINSIFFKLEHEITMAYDGKIRQALDEIPLWTERSASLSARNLSKLILYEYLLLLHQPFTAQDMVKSRQFYHRITRRNASLVIMKLYTQMPFNSSLSFSNLRDDLFRAALANCHDICLSDDPKDDILYNETISMDLMEKTTALLEDRVRHMGEGIHTFWITLSALSLMRSKISHDIPAENFARQAAERLLSMQRDMIRGQENAQNKNVLNNGRPQLPQNRQENKFTEGGRTQMPPFDALTPPIPFDDLFFDLDMSDLWNMGTLNYP